MYSNVISASVCGVEAVLVNVEVDSSVGIPVFEMSGYLGVEVKEAKERVRVSIKNSGIELKPQKIVVNISPANIRKDGTAFDLPIALGIMGANGLINSKCFENFMVIGELSLDGHVNGVKGVLACVSEAVKNGISACIVPWENRREASIIDEMNVYAVRNLEEVFKFLNGDNDIKEEIHNKNDYENLIVDNINDEDFEDVKGQYVAKRATMIAVAGMHNILYIGSPGCGKTMIAKRIPTIMPDLLYEESLEVTKIHSIAGILKKDGSLISKRPFRSPHNNITTTALLGGGRFSRPGEITLAGKGVLFLDELTQFKCDVLESLRQPLEDKKITVVRLNTAYTYPADFMLVAAMNPCKCGYYPDRNRCNCSEYDIERYLGKISSPMWDRFDLCVQVDEIKLSDIKGDNLIENNIDSGFMKNCVYKARKMQEKRFIGRKIHFNSEMSAKDINKFCILDKRGEEIMEKSFSKLNLTARGYHKILKTARTIADIEESEIILSSHISEAITYRNYNRRL